MSNRITRKDAEQALRVYCNRAGLPFGHYLTIKNDEELQHLIDTDPMRLVPAALFHVHDDGRRSYVLTGGLAIDCAYGGYQVQQIIGTSNGDGRNGSPCTGVRTPFGGGYREANWVQWLDAGAGGYGQGLFAPIYRTWLADGRVFDYAPTPWQASAWGQGKLPLWWEMRP